LPKLTLQGCKHPLLRPWGADYDPWTSEGMTQVTCLVCYERLLIGEGDPAAHAYSRRTARSADYSHLAHADPALPCQHQTKTPIEKPEKFTHGEYTDALCEECGVVLRHPEGPGRWEEVIFNGYVIREEP
jgi:ribosomal protein S27E